MPFEWWFSFLYELENKCSRVVYWAKWRGCSVPWCHGTDVQNSNCLHQTVAIRQRVETHLVLILSEWGAEVEDFYIAEFEQILPSFHQMIKDSANCPQPGPHSLMYSVIKLQAITWDKGWNGRCQTGNSGVFEWFCWIVTGSFNWEVIHETFRGEPNTNQTYPIFNVLSCVFVGNIFLGGLPFLCWVQWLGFLLNSGGRTAGDRNAKAKHRSLAKENKLSLKKTHN